MKLELEQRARQSIRDTRLVNELSNFCKQQVRG
jgi:hypothetical protein